jgi:hypothetical protein
MGSEATGSGMTAAGAFFFSITGWGFFEKMMRRERRGCVRE